LTSHLTSAATKVTFPSLASKWALRDFQRLLSANPSRGAAAKRPWVGLDQLKPPGRPTTKQDTRMNLTPLRSAPIDRSMLGEVGDLGYYPAATEPLTREMPK